MGFKWAQRQRREKIQLGNPWKSGGIWGLAPVTCFSLSLPQSLCFLFVFVCFLTVSFYFSLNLHLSPSPPPFYSLCLLFGHRSLGSLRTGAAGWVTHSVMVNVMSWLSLLATDELWQPAVTGQGAANRPAPRYFLSPNTSISSTWLNECGAFYLSSLSEF